jgi:hypothetical protein
MNIERAGAGSSLVDVLDRVLDKGIVVDAWVRVSIVGIDLVTVEARRHEKPGASTTGIIPGNRGKAGGNWCHQPLSGASRRQANITSSSGP